MIENAEKIVVSLNSTNENCKSAVDCINNAIKSMDKIANVDEKYNNKLSELKSIYYEIDEFTRDIEESNDELYFDDNERNEVETRLDLIYSLKRKYGNSIEEIINYKDKIEEEIENNKLKEELKLIEKDMDKLSKELHEIRVEKAQILNTRINQELKDLEMGKAEFITQINEVEKFNSRGKDDIEFYIRTNIGEEAKPLNKIASGGEMSRIMLSIKTVLAESDKVPVMIFDEIDTGISGKAAKMVGQKLKYIGNSHQVICITHQASIAAKGDQNYFINKEVLNERTHTNIKRLLQEEIIDEIARIANGDITDISRKHALELIHSV